MAAAVLAMADARCREISPSSVVLNRLGVRAWGGIGLASALMIAIGLISANPMESEASFDPFQSPSASLATALPQPGMSQAATVTSPPQPGRAMALDHPDPDDNGFNPARDITREVARAAGANQATDTANPQGAGAGAGRSTANNPADPLMAVGGNSARTANAGSAAPGTGLFTESPGSAQGPGGKTAGENPTPLGIPVWSTPTWPAAQSSAAAAIRTGQVPPEYHDLIRAYFAR